jgi:hypothetical protein
MSWEPSYPKLTHKVKDVPGYAQANFNALATGMAREHPGTTYTKHTPGGCGAIFYGTTAEIAALTTPGSGALAYDTNLGLLVRYSGSVWQEHNKTVAGVGTWSRIRAYANALTTSILTTNTDIPLDAETYDTLSEYNTGIGFATISASGVYLIAGSVTLSGDISGNLSCGSKVQIIAGGVTGTYYSGSGSMRNTAMNASPYASFPFCFIRWLNATDMVGVAAIVYTPGRTVVVVNGSTSTWMCIHRLPWGGVF